MPVEVAENIKELSGISMFEYISMETQADTEYVNFDDECDPEIFDDEIFENEPIY